MKYIILTLMIIIMASCDYNGKSIKPSHTKPENITSIDGVKTDEVDTIVNPIIDTLNLKR